MRKTFLLEDLCCANCAAKIETEIGKLAGVDKCTVAFLTTKLVIEAADEKMDDIVKEAMKIVKKIEPDVTVVAK